MQNNANIGEEETGLKYSLVLDDHQQLIGVKRFGGFFCYRCNASLLVYGEEAGRSAVKLHSSKCPICGTDNGQSADILPCCTFDWIMAPHLLPRRSTFVAGDDVTDESQRRRRMMAKPSNRVVDQYGNEFDVDHFWKRVVDPCPVQFYERICQ